MSPEDARRMWRPHELVHDVVYFSPESRAAALMNLALLLPFVAVAQRLTPVGETTPQLEPAPA